MIEFKNYKVINPTPRREPSKPNFVLKDLALKYYDTLEPIVNDLASKCSGGEECKLSFSNGTVIIKLK
jgi:hypothetical protein